MRSRVAIASVVALLLVVAYVRAQQFGNQPAKLLSFAATAVPIRFS